jgi:quercetin dioxygenase-like cupin family protein
MKITDVSTLPVSPNPHHVNVRKAYESPHAVAVVITLKPGEALKMHITPVDVFFYVLEGIGCVVIGDERTTLERTCWSRAKAWIPHRWINESTGLFRVLVVKVPGPAEETKLL